tara:strand:+ start:359 stop:496 length:138 start_codon:yes stop_codon:yes gene_type:complete
LIDKKLSDCTFIYLRFLSDLVEKESKVDEFAGDAPSVPGVMASAI